MHAMSTARRASRAPPRCRFVTVWGSGLTLVLVVLWPLLALPAKDFNEGYFTFWTIIAIVWGILASLAMIFMPVRPTHTYSWVCLLAFADALPRFLRWLSGARLSARHGYREQRKRTLVAWRHC